MTFAPVPPGHWDSCRDGGECLCVQHRRPEPSATESKVPLQRWIGDSIDGGELLANSAVHSLQVGAVANWRDGDATR